MKRPTISIQLSLISSKTAEILLVALVIMISLSGCAQAQPLEATVTNLAATASPVSTAPPMETNTPSATIIPQTALTAEPLPMESPEVLSATKEGDMTQPSPSPIPADSITTRWINQAVQDLAGRLNTGVDEIQVAAFEPVVWPDGGLGCPEPGMFYTQVQVEGFRIRLQHGGQTYDYHGSMSREPFLCEIK